MRGTGNARDVALKRMIARFSRNMVTANEVSSMATSGAPLIGRYAMRSISRPANVLAAIPAAEAHTKGSPPNSRSSVV
jgi:hypothetical protein